MAERLALLRQLELNEKDLVIMGKPPGGRDLIAEPFMENPLVVIAPPGHELASKKHIPLKNARYPLTGDFMRRKPGNIATLENYLAARRTNTASNHIEDGALPGSIGTNHSQNLCIIYLEV